MSHPSVTVISVYYNRAAYVRDSIQSLLDQSLEDIEIIVVDDGSTDGTVEQLHAFSDPRLTVIARQNGGLTSALRQAAERARGRYVAVHGSGDISHRRRLEKQAALLDDRPEVGVVGCWVAKELKPGGPWVTHKPNTSRPFRETVMDENPFTHGEVMMRRNLYHHVGGYRTVFTYAQDRDLWLRMSKLCDFDVVPDVLYDRCNIPGGISSSPRKRIAQQMLSDFAIQCARDVDAGRPDLAEVYGLQGPAFRRRSRRFARQLGTMSMRWALDGRTNDAALLADAALRESRTSVAALCAALLIGLQRQPWLWSILKSGIHSARNVRSSVTKRNAALPETISPRDR